MKGLMVRFVREDQGQDLIEYALLAGFISLVAVVAITAVGTGVNAVYEQHRRPGEDDSGGYGFVTPTTVVGQIPARPPGALKNSMRRHRVRKGRIEMMRRWLLECSTKTEGRI